MEEFSAHLETSDSGLYTFSYIEGVGVQMLIDSGATCSLISKETYKRCAESSDLQIEGTSTRIKGVEGSNIKVHGAVNVDMQKGPLQVQFKLIVADMAQPGILGQDFLMKHVKNLNMESPALQTKHGSFIPCFFKDSRGINRVTTTEDVVIPPNTCKLASVSVESPSLSHKWGFVESNLDGDLTIFEGIVEMGKSLHVGIVNHTEVELLIEAGRHIGVCRMIDEEPHHQFEEYVRTATGTTLPTDQHREETLPEHLKEMFDKSIEFLDVDQQLQFKTLLTKYQDIFAKSSDDLGCTDRVKHTIDMRDAKPIRQPVRRQPYGKREMEKEEISKMLAKGVIEPSNSPWSSPIVLVTKKDGSTRFCVDYRKLNDVTVKDAYPIPRVDDCLDALSGAKWFNCMDLCSGFWQIEMDQQDKMKTAFSTISIEEMFKQRMS